MESLPEQITRVGWQSLLTSAALSLFIVWYIRTYWTRIAANLPPGPQRKPFPFNIMIGLLSGNPIDNMISVNKKYGDIVFIHEGNKPMILIASQDMVQQLIVKRADVTSGRLNIPIMKLMGNYKKGGIVLSQGDVWAENRRFGLAALRNFGMGKKSIEHRINEEAQMLCAEIARSSDKPFDPHAIINNAVSNIICSISFGNRFEYSDPNFALIVSEVNNFTSSNLGFISEIPSIFLWAERQTVRKLKEFLTQQIKEHAKNLDSNDIRDFIDMYLLEVRRLRAAGERTLLDVDHLWLTLFDIFIGGTDTTSMTLLWCIIIMADRPEIQKRIFTEINAVIGSGRNPSYDDRNNMPYTQAFLYEAQRFRPVIPMGLPHLVTKDFTFRDYIIPKGTEIMINIMAIHHDPKTWENPGVFKPERFLSPDGKSVVKNTALMPFGAGRRICLGEQLAKMELFLFFTSMAQRFSFKFPNDVKADYSYGHRITTLLPMPYEVLAVER